MTLYITKEYHGWGKQNYYWYEYCLEDDTVVRYKCNRHKHFDGDENEWVETRKKNFSWKKDSPLLPEWLKQYL